MMIRKRGWIWILICAAFIVILAAGRFLMKPSSEKYASHGLWFVYPKGWALRESEGQSEKYFQVHVFGRPDERLKFGPSISLTVYPKTQGGGRFDALAPFVEQALARKRKLPDFRLLDDSHVPISCCGTARQTAATFALNMPIDDPLGKRVALKERVLFFEKGGNLFVFSYSNFADAFGDFEKAFETAVRSLTVS